MTASLIVTENVRDSAPAGALVVPLSSRIRRKREFFGVMKKHLRLPNLYHDNWDALYDVLRDLESQADAQPIVLRHDGLPFRAESRQRAIYLEFLRGLLSEGFDANRELRIVLPSTEATAIAHLRGVVAPADEKF